MSPDELVRRFFSEVFNDGRTDAALVFIHAEHRNHDIHFEHDDVITVGDKVAHRWTFAGTHRGEIMGIEPTGRSVTVKGIEMNRIADGKIAESWAISDALGLLEQLGAEPPGA